MKLKKRIISAALAAFLILSLPASAAENREDISSDDEIIPTFSAAHDGNLKGIMVQTAYNKDYPPKPGTTAAAMGLYADEIVQFAKDYQYNAIVYEASPRADAMYVSKHLPNSRFMVTGEGDFTLADPLKILLETAQMEKVGFFVSLSPYYAGEVKDTYAENSPVVIHPEWFITKGSSLYFNPAIPEVQNYWINIVEELVSKYALDGIILTDLDCPAISDVPGFWKGSKNLAVKCMKAAKKANPEIYTGASMSHAVIDRIEGHDFILSVASEAEFILPHMAVSVSSEENYGNYLHRWADLVRYSDAALYTQNCADKLRVPKTEELIFGDKRELNYQIYCNALVDIDGYVMDSYHDIIPFGNHTAAELNTVPESFRDPIAKLMPKKDDQLILSVPESLIFTGYNKYFITGHCNPSEPLYMNGEQIDRITKDGFFGVFVDLKRGANYFHFNQKNEESQLTLYTTRGASSVLHTIDDILEDSVFPQENEILFEGSPLRLSCIAPYGGTVTARFQGKNYILTPEKEMTPDDIGRPVTYSAEIQPETFTHSQTQNLGKVNYILEFEDFTVKYRSYGEVYLVGNSSRLAVRINDSLGRVYQDSSETNLVGNLLFGACDFASSTNTDFFRLQSGGYIHKGDVSVIEGFVDIQKSVQTVGIQSHEQGENLIFVGGEGLPYHVSFQQNPGILNLTVYNMSVMPKSLSHLASDLFEKIIVEADETNGIMKVHFHLAKDKTLWGYHVSYQNGNMILQCKTPPAKPAGNKSLEGVTVVLDPGHGGSNSGYTGLLGKKGPSEKDITLAYAQTLRRRLEVLGADVYMTRADDTTIAEEDRILYNDFKNADFYISFHMDSSEEDEMAWDKEGFKVYYNYELSRDLGYKLYKKSVHDLRVPAGGLSQEELSIAQVPLARSAIICPGNISNPQEYERIINPVQIYKTACTISDVLEEYIKEYAPQ